jgi:Met-zincin/Domain of unknown function (DUF5117)/Domain of unknown function (DUF5118)
MRAKILGTVVAMVFSCGFLAWLPALAQGPQDEERADEAKKDDAGPGRLERPKIKIRPYDRVITKEAKTSPGLFLVHRIEDKVYFEIPTAELGKEMLWVTQLEQTQAGYSHAGEPVGDRVVRWEQRGDDILLRDVKYEIRADVNDPIKDAVKATSLEAIIAVLPIQAFGKDKRPVVDVTPILTGDLPEFTARRRLRASGIDPRRTFIDKVKAFPTNIEAKVLMTYRPRGAGGLQLPTGPTIPIGDDSALSGVTVMLHHSLIDLPDAPMHPRRYDDRVGLFSVSFEDYGSPKQEVEKVRYVTRWRLEKKDPKAAVSEPKKPIVFYVGREVPAKYRPWIRKGIEAWQPAFEKAGYKNAILAKEPPSPQEDADWDAEDARYSSIRWLPSTIENAYGPHVHDPRTGEILEADIRVYHNILKLVRDWYFVQASPSDLKAQTLPLSDDLMGELLAYVTSHEVGHSLGFRHNMKASSSYTIEQLRNPEFTRKNGVEASIMDYGRFNYVAQPGDGARLIPIIGPYDEFAVEWGYREFPDAKTYAQEKKELEKITARQLEDVKLRFGDPNPFEDPSQQMEDLGSDPIGATELGLKNLDRVAGYLVKATAKSGENYELLGEMYEQLLGQRRRELGHVASLVGGFVRNNLWYPEGKKVFEPVQAAQQKKAVAFLIEHGFRTPASLIAPDVLDRLESHGTAERILAAQQSLLRSLVNKTRLDRMSELATRVPTDAYTPADLVNDLHAGIFWPAPRGHFEIDLYRRNLQRAYVDLLAGFLDNPADNSDLPALARAELEELSKEVKAIFTAESQGTATVNLITRKHLEDIKTRADHALDPIPSAPAPQRSPLGLPVRRGDEAPEPPL